MGSDPVVAIVDDDEAVRTSLASFVRALGCAVRCYPSADAFLDDRREDPDFMICDMTMPSMSGEELQAELIASGRSFPLVLVTAFPTEAARERVMAAGARAYLEKPADIEIVADMLEASLRSRRG